MAQPVRQRLGLQALEVREACAVTAVLNAGVLAVAGSPGADRIGIEVEGNDVVVRERNHEIARFGAAGVSLINVDGGAGQDVIRVGRDVAIPVNILGGAGNDKLIGGVGPTSLDGGIGKNLLKVGGGPTNADPGPDRSAVVGVKAGDVVVPRPLAVVKPAGGFAVQNGPQVLANQLLDTMDVEQLLRRAAAVSSSDDAIIAIVDRNGRILGVRVEAGVSPSILNDPNLLTFAVDGAVAKARTAAFFSSNAAPLTSRTIRFISQSTITQREVESLPFDTDPNSVGRGPGYVAPVGSGGHFPPDIPLTPQVDLFGIEHSNRDSILHPGADRIRTNVPGDDDVLLPNRFNIAALAPGVELFPPESYGFAFGQEQAQARGIATLPGGVPLYKNGQLVGGIGVFFPGKTGFATEENSSLSTIYDPTRPDRTLEAEFIAFQTVGAAPGIGFPPGTFSGVTPLPGFALPLDPDNQRIDLVGITLDIIGPGGLQGPRDLTRYGQTLRPGNPDSGFNAPVAPAKQFESGKPVSEGWLVEPKDGVGFTKEEVRRIIEQGIAQANQTRAAIRLPLDTRTRMVFAVTDHTGEVLGLFRMPDAAVFSIDVAIAKARNASYYADANALQTIDQVNGVPAGTALTARTFRYLAEPRFPEGIDGRPPGPFSIYNDGGSDPLTGRQVGPRLAASAFQSVYGFDSFNPGTNFHDPRRPENQNGVIFFPGSAPLYRNTTLIGGLGVSGDGVDQDDVVTALSTTGFKVPATVLRADLVTVNGVRLPYQKFNRNPED